VRFDAALRSRLTRHLAAHRRLVVTDAELTPAAVVVAIVGARDHAGFWLTRRVSQLGSHTGQWALPGGRVDEGEAVVDAALRELAEELAVGGVDVLGMLDDYPTRSGYCITPVVAWADREVVPSPNPAEVAEVHHVALAELDQPDVPRWARVPEVDGPLIQIPVVDTLVHAPTGAIMYQLREVALHGRATRVADLDEPPFAWR
jgi:8-oxo-dGTP pyrophosphatase MutT (NUDIX family)